MGPQGGRPLAEGASVAYAPFEAQWARMVGVEDGVNDALFRFTRPITGAYFWCPPLKDGRLDLAALDLVG
jgi:putative iron-dependent peroxidase